MLIGKPYYSRRTVAFYHASSWPGNRLTHTFPSRYLARRGFDPALMHEYPLALVDPGHKLHRQISTDADDSPERARQVAAPDFHHVAGLEWHLGTRWHNG